MPNKSISKGLKLELRPLKSVYAQGEEIPDFEAIISNISMGPITFCAYHQEHRLLSTLGANDIYIYYFGTTPSQPLQSADFIKIMADTSLTIPLKISGRQEYAFLCGTSLPVSFRRERGMTGFPSGDYTFSASLGRYINLYQAPEETHNFSMQIVDIFDLMQQSGLTIAPSEVWDGEITASCTVAFK